MQAAAAAATTQQVLAGWGGIDLFSRMAAEACPSTFKLRQPLSLPCTAEDGARAWDAIGNDDALDWLVVSNEFDLHLLREMARARRKSEEEEEDGGGGGGLFLLVIVLPPPTSKAASSSCAYSLTFASFAELSMLSAVFERPTPELAQAELSLLQELVEYRAEGGGGGGAVIATLNPNHHQQQDHHHQLVRLASQQRVHQSIEQGHAPHHHRIQVISGSFLALAGALLLRSAWDAATTTTTTTTKKQQQPKSLSERRKLADCDGLLTWWDEELDESMRASILPSTSSLRVALTSVPVGSPQGTSLLDDVVRWRANLTSAALLREEEEGGGDEGGGDGSHHESGSGSGGGGGGGGRRGKRRGQTKSKHQQPLHVQLLQKKDVDSVLSSSPSSSDAAVLMAQLASSSSSSLTLTASSSDLTSFSEDDEEEEEEGDEDGQDDAAAWETVLKRASSSSSSSSRARVGSGGASTTGVGKHAVTTPRHSRRRGSVTKPRASSLLVELNPETSQPLVVVVPSSPSPAAAAPLLLPPSSASSSPCLLLSSSRPATPSSAADRKSAVAPSPLALSHHRKRPVSDGPFSAEASPPPSPSSSSSAYTIKLSHLSNDIAEMAAALDLVAMRRQPWQLAIAERVKQVVYSIWPRAWVDVFGSIATGLAAPCSDVDVVVRGASTSPPSVDGFHTYLQQHHHGIGGGGDSFASTDGPPTATRVLADQLKNLAWVEMLQVVERTAVPVVKFKTAAIPIAFGNRGNLIAVDITFENESHHGLNTCGLVRQLVQRWPLLKPLVLVLKQFLVEKGLNDAYVGGISSYGLVIMIAFVLRRNDDGRASVMGLGDALVDFLQLFSSPAFRQMGVSLNHKEMVLKPARFASDPCYIEDPLDPFNNVGRSCFGIGEVQAVFAQALLQINGYDVSTATPSTSVLGRVFATSHHNDVVQLVTAVWCPIEVVTKPAPPQPQPPPPTTATGRRKSSAASSPPPPASSSSMATWAEEVRDALLNAASRVQTGEPNECPMCNQTLGAAHVASKCGFMILAKKCPL